MAPRTRSKAGVEPTQAEGAGDKRRSAAATAPHEATKETSRSPAKAGPSSKKATNPKQKADKPKASAKSKPADQSKSKPKPKGRARDKSPSEGEYSSSDETTFRRPYRGLLPPPLPGYRGTVRATAGDNEKYEILSYSDFEKEYRPHLKYHCTPYAPYD